MVPNTSQIHQALNMICSEQTAMEEYTQKIIEKNRSTLGSFEATTEMNLAAKPGSKKEVTRKYKELIASLAVYNWQDLLSEDILISMDLPRDEKITVVSGQYFRPDLFGFKQQVPEIKEYLFYYFVNPIEPHVHHRLLMCQFTSDSLLSIPCGKIFSSFGSFFDHVRIHEGTSPYKCDHPGCNKRFI